MDRPAEGRLAESPAAFHAWLTEWRKQYTRAAGGMLPAALDARATIYQLNLLRVAVEEQTRTLQALRRELSHEHRDLLAVAARRHPAWYDRLARWWRRRRELRREIAAQRSRALGA